MKGPICVTEFPEEDKDTADTPEFHALVCEPLELYGDNSRSQDAYMVEIDIDALSKAMSELNTYATFAVYNHILLDTSDPKSICSEHWLQRTNWHPITKIMLSSSTNGIEIHIQKNLRESNISHITMAK